MQNQCDILPLFYSAHCHWIAHAPPQAGMPLYACTRLHPCAGTLFRCSAISVGCMDGVTEGWVRASITHSQLAYPKHWFRGRLYICLKPLKELGLPVNCACSLPARRAQRRSRRSSGAP